MKAIYLMPVFLISLILCHQQIATAETNSNSINNYNIKEGQWVKYGPIKIDVKSDNAFLRLLVKGILSKVTNLPVSIPSSIGGTMGANLTLADFLKMEWLMVNVSKINGDDVTVQASVKLKDSQNVTHVNRTNTVTGTDNDTMFLFYMPKEIKVGDTINVNLSNQIIPLTINNTKEKTIDTRVVHGYDAIGTVNSYNETIVSANEKTVRLFIDKETGRVLDFDISIEVGNFLGTVKADVTISAIDWS